MPNYRHRSSKLFRYLVTSQVAAGDDASAPVLTETRPPEAELIPFRGQGWDGIMVIPFGAGADTQDFKLILQGYWQIREGSAGPAPWQQDYSASATTDEQWLGLELLTCTVDLTTKVGSAGAPLVATDRLADTVVVTNGDIMTAMAAATDFGTPTKFDTTDLAAAGFVAMIPCQPDFLWMGFDMSAGGGVAATSGNCVYQLFAT
jgi:hypothetical protein